MDTNRDDLLISRVVDGDATEADWAELEESATRDTAVWTQLAASLKAETMVRRVFDDRLALADSIDLPVLPEAERLETSVLETAPTGADSPAIPTTFSKMKRVASTGAIGLGWAAALLFAALWWSRGTEPSGSRLVDTPGSSAPTTGLTANDPADGSGRTLDHGLLSADDAFVNYYDAGIREGRLLRELPRVLVDSRPLPDQGAVEVLYVRRLLERQKVDRFYELNHNELGGRVATPVSFDQVGRRSSL